MPSTPHATSSPTPNPTPGTSTTSTPGTVPLEATLATVTAAPTTAVANVSASAAGTVAAATTTTGAAANTASSSSGQAASSALVLGLGAAVALLVVLVVVLYVRWRRVKGPVKPEQGLDEQLYEVPLTPLGSVREAPFMLRQTLPPPHIYDNVVGASAVDLEWPDDGGRAEINQTYDSADDAFSVTSLDIGTYDLPKTTTYMTQPAHGTTHT